MLIPPIMLSANVLNIPSPCITACNTHGIDHMSIGTYTRGSCLRKKFA